MRLEAKVSLISGGARGIGAAQAWLFSKEGATVVLGDVRESEGLALEKLITQSGGKAFFLRLDVSVEQSWIETVESTVNQFGQLDVLINNAAIYTRVPIASTTLKEWDEVMAINARGVFLGTKHAIPAMRKAGYGSIINISSTAGLVGSERGSAYGSSKGAVRLLTKYTAIQHAADGIRANSIHPGAIDTDMISDNLATPAARAASEGRVPLGRIGTAEDVANAALFLASDESSYMTGSELIVDGGMTAQ